MSAGFDNVEDVYALSPLQLGILYHCLAEPAAGVFVNQLAVELSLPLDVERFKESWQVLVARHTALRTGFLWDGLDEPLQVVREQVELPWQILDWQEDWRDLDAQAQKRAVEAWLRQDRERGFDLACAPLMKMALAQVSEDRWMWLWSFHHIILDGWSTRILIREVKRLYAQHATSVADSLPAAKDGETFLYRDFIAHQAAVDQQQAEAFWRRELAGFSRSSFLTASTGWAPGEGQLGQVSGGLSQAETEELTAFARQRRLTLSTVLQGAWAVVVGHYARAEDVVFGVTSAGRPADLEDADRGVGLFINTLPLRVELTREATVTPWLQGLQRRQFERLEWELTPLHSIQAWSELEAQQPLFDSLLVFENLPDSGAHGTNEPFDPEGRPLLSMESPRFYEQSNYPVAVLVVPGKRLEVLVVRAPDGPSQRQTAQLLERLLFVLREFLRRPDGLVSAVRLASPVEVAAEVAQFNRSTLNVPLSQCVNDLIRATARSRPDHVAVVSEEASLSYGQLLERAHQVAATLQQHGVSPGDLVGLFAERSPDLIAGLLGVLEAGAAYVPLDPSYPRDHLARVTSNAGLSCILNCTGAGETPTFSPEVPAVCLPPMKDRSTVDGAGLPSDFVPGVCSLDSLAYVIHTSGSAGVPKGVAITHRNLLCSTLARLQVYKQPMESFLLLSSFAFDSSVAGIFWTLISGGTLVLPQAGEEQDLEALAGLIDQHRVTHTLCLPALYRLLLTETKNSLLNSLRVVAVAGEACPPQLPALHRRLLPQTSLYNEYGPTEATVWATVEPLYEPGVNSVISREPSQRSDESGALAFACSPVPIGHVIPNVQAFVVDAQLELVPPGVAGELLLAGPSLARGYLNQPELTASSFLPLKEVGCGTPVGAGERVYRTGDLVVQQGDGKLVFLGRVDQQVKIRGHRIEPQAIESALETDPLVAEVAVVVEAPDTRTPSPPNATGSASSSFRGSQLVAYCVGSFGVGEPDPARGIRERLTKVLPAFMIPDQIHFLKALPRRPNGKLDVRALQSFVGTADSEPREAAGLTTATEKILAEVWTELLGLQQVGPEDHFFRLGGDSILSIQLVSKVRQLGLRLAPAEVGRYPRLTDLAACCDRNQASHSVEVTEPAEVVGAVPLLPIQQWFLGRNLVAPHHWNLSRCFGVPEDLDLKACGLALAELLRCHDQLRATFWLDDIGAWHQEILAVDAVQWPLEQREVGDLPELRAALLEAQANLDLARGPLVRALYVTAKEGASADVSASFGGSVGLLLLVVHHLVVDVVSWNLLTEDVARAYSAFSADQADFRLRRGTPFQQWATRLRRDFSERQASGANRDELAFWQQALKQTGSLLRRPDPSAELSCLERQARRFLNQLPERETAELLGAAKQAYGTRVDELLIVALLLALNLSLEEAERETTKSWTIAVEQHGREHPRVDADLSRTVGWCTVSYPVTLQLKAADDLSKTIKSVKEQLRSAAAVGSSFGWLRSSLKGSSLASRLTEEPEVLLNYLGQQQGDPASGPLRPWRFDTSTSRDGNNQRSHLLEINASVVSGALQFEWIYSPGLLADERLKKLADDFTMELTEVLRHCLSDGSGGFTTSDFPDAELGGEELDFLLDQLD